MSNEPTWQKPLHWWAPWRTWAVRREWERQALIVMVYTATIPDRQETP